MPSGALDVAMCASPGILLKLASAGKAKASHSSGGGGGEVALTQLGPDHGEQVPAALRELCRYLLQTPVRAKLATAAVTYLLRASRAGGGGEVQTAAVEELGQVYVQCLARRTCKLQVKFFVSRLR